MLSFNRQAIVDRLTEPSTWRGLFMIATAVGVAVSPEMQNAIVALGMSIVGLIGVLTSSKQG
jgi:hypothetical protein